MNRKSEKEDLFPDTFRFVVPYQDDPGFVSGIAAWKEYIDRVYLPMPPQFMGSGRPWSKGEPESYRERLPEIVGQLRESGLLPEIACNSVLPESSMFDEAVVYLRSLIACGAQTVTVAYLPFAVRLRREFPDLELKASTIAYIHDTARLERWIEDAGIQAVVPDRSLNKDIEALRRLKKSGVTISIVMDDVCFASCPMQFQHYQLFSMMGGCRPVDVGGDLDLLEEHCPNRRRESSWRMFQFYIVPGDLKHYAGVVDSIKLGRGGNKSVDHLIREMKHYMDPSLRTHFYLGYFEPEDSWDKLGECDRICRKCRWCEKVFHELNEPTESPDGDASILWRPKNRSFESPFKP